MVLDFVDAFWQGPIQKRERKYCVGRVRGFYFIYRRTPQGSRNGPFSWAVLAAQAGRLAQSVFIEKSPPQTMATRRNLSLANRLLARYSLRLNIYVDGPLAVTRGTRAQRDRNFCEPVLIWMVFGFSLSPLPKRKGERKPNGLASNRSSV